MGAQKRQKKRLFELAAQQQRGFQGISKGFCELLFQRRDYIELCDEWIQWRAFLQQFPSVPTKPSPLKMLQIMKEYNLQSGFPNVCIALRVYLTLPVSNCSGERSFSHLKPIKNASRSTIAQDRLTNLTLMNIECEIVQALDFQQLRVIHLRCPEKIRFLTPY